MKTTKLGHAAYRSRRERLKKKITAFESEIMKTTKHGYAASRSSREQLEMDSGAIEMQSGHGSPEWFHPGKKHWSIPKVPYRLREVKQRAYEPNVISIGPYHYGKEHLRAMDDIKRSSFDKISESIELEFRELVHEMKSSLERALNYYERPLHDDLTSENFIEMMIYDGCFIIQLIRSRPLPKLDVLSRYIKNDMKYDLLLLENQLPFFVLLKLDTIISPTNALPFYSLALSYFKDGKQIWSGNGTSPSPEEDIKHLLDMVHKCCLPSSQGIEQHLNYITKEAQEQKRLKVIRSASDLKNAGIKFVGEKNAKSFFDVTFTEYTAIMGLDIHNKVLKIPTLRIDYNMERILLNLMAWEQFTPFNEPTYVTDYAVFMDNLVNTGKDVQLLCSAGFIDNWLGDDEVVAQMFNKLGESIYCSENSYYTEIYDKVEKHCKGSWNTYKAKLKRDYFNSPWTVVSFLAAVILLLATILQSIYAVVSYHRPS